MYIRQITEDKKQFLPLLLLGDENESMVDRYLERGEMFVLYAPELLPSSAGEGSAIASCVVTDEGSGVSEIKNLAVHPLLQRKGYGRQILDYVTLRYARKGYNTLLLGTGDSPGILSFYERCGFTRSHSIPNFFTDHYPHPIIEEGRQLRDMIYLKKSLSKPSATTITALPLISDDEENELLQLWEASVRSTHPFLAEADIAFYKKMIPSCLPHVNLYKIENENNQLIAFMGLSRECIEMLFVHPSQQSKGIGTKLLCFAIDSKHLRRVDVNEQNATALRFYLHHGFEVTGRDETDSFGKHYPILHLQLPDKRVTF